VPKDADEYIALGGNFDMGGTWDEPAEHGARRHFATTTG
jgi:hypothetical protein